MLETYYIKPGTVDGVRASWIGAGIESYDGAHGNSPALITETPQVSTRAGSGGV